MKLWQKTSIITWLLAPFSLLFWLISQIRIALYRKKILKSYRSPVPVLVIGNISVGGNGKTPLVVMVGKIKFIRSWLRQKAIQN